MVLYGLIPPHEKELCSTRFVHIPGTNDIDVVNTEDLGITVVAIVPIIMLKQHNVAMRGSRIDDVLSPSNVVSCIIEPHEVVVINSVTFKENGSAFLVGMSGLLHRRSRSCWASTVQNMVL
jgi:hypothetical protein